MKELIIKASEDSPRIELIASENIFHISERSFPENATEFYKPIIDWFNEYKTSPNSTTILEVKLEYFNTSSSKQLAKILLILEKISKTSSVLIKWFFAENDIDILSSGKRYAKLIDLKFEFIQL